MEIILFNPRKTTEGSSLFDIISLHKNPEDDVVVYDSLESFTKKLTNTKYGKTISVIFAAREEDLIDIYFHKHYLYKTTTILILPNSKQEIIALGHRCNPLFLITNYGDLKKIGPIIRTLTSREYIKEDYKHAA